MINIKEYADNEIVKSLRSVGLSDEYICENIENGNIKIEKSCKKEHIEKAEEDFEGDKKFSEHKDKDGKTVYDEGEIEKYHDDGEEVEVDKKKKVEKDKKEDDMDIHKSMMMDSRLENIEKSIETLTSILGKLTSVAPSFKGANFSSATLEKSMNTVDEDGKVEMNIMTQRYDVRNIIAKAISEEKDDSIRKSLTESSRLYLTDPSCSEIGKETAMYLYGKGIRLTK